jgi:hypothetical protein
MMEGQGDPFGAASHFLGGAGLGRRIQLKNPKHSHSIISMWPTLMPSLGPIAHQTMAAEPPQGHGLDGDHLTEVQNLIILWCPTNFAI